MESDQLPRRRFLKGLATLGAATALPNVVTTPESYGSAATGERGIGFEHRFLLGWISEYVTRSLPGVWPQIPLDDETLDDFDAYFDLALESGYNGLIVWGLFVHRDWPLDIRSCVDRDRRRRIARLIESAHQRGLKLIGGLGVYSWGIDTIVKANPHLAPSNRRAMCPSLEESHQWMKRILDFVLEFGLDGFDMQSADHGRCTCKACAPTDDISYHCDLITRTADTIRGKKKDATLLMNNWGARLKQEEDVGRLRSISNHLTCLINPFNQGARFRTQLAKELGNCTYGTLVGRSVWNPQGWSSDRWFIPITLSNVDYMRALYADGGRAATQFVANLGNPGDELAMRFGGLLLQAPTTASEALLRRAVEACFEPRDSATTDALCEISMAAENAYFESHKHPIPDLFCISTWFGGSEGHQPNDPPLYLTKLVPAKRQAYLSQMAAIQSTFKKIMPGIGLRDKAERLTRCLENVIRDIENIA